MEKGYMLDTNVLIHLAGTPEDLHWFKEGLGIGYIYFITPVQENEWSGYSYKYEFVGRVAAHEVKKQELFQIGNVIEALKCQMTSSIASWHKGIRLDGSERFMPKGNVAFLTEPITHKSNSKHLGDNLIAEAVKNHNLVLVTNDKKLYNRIKRVYPKNVMKHNEFISNIKMLLNRE